MILRAAWKAMRERRQRLGLALAALTVAATLSTTLLGLYADLERKLRGEFHGYGPNLILAPAGDGSSVPLALLRRADDWGQAAPFLYRVETLYGDPVVVAEADFARLGPLTGYWRVEGRRVAAAEECLIGERVAAQFHLEVGSEIDIGGRKRRVAGIVSTGAGEDSQILVPLEGAHAVSLIALRVDGGRIEQARQALAAPGVEVRVLRAVAEAEAAVVLKVRGTLFLLSVVVLGITVLCVMNNFGALVYQRRQEIGILKALGGGEGRIAALFASEAAVLGILGSLGGFGLGTLVARWIAWQIFRQPAGLQPETLPAVVGITVAVSLLATVGPLRGIRRIEPAVILRGE